MKRNDERSNMYPIRDWLDNSPMLSTLSWNSKVMGTLIREGFLGGKYLRSAGSYMTSKDEIIKTFELMNEVGNVPKIDLEAAEELLRAFPKSD